MHIRNLAQKFEISYVIKDKWHLPVHKHTHYELQFIIRGKGQHNINDQMHNYQKGDLFILPPHDNHFFIFNERTAICVVKFHEGFFEELLNDADFKLLLNRFSSPNRRVRPLGSNREHIESLMELIIAEHRKPAEYQNFIIKSALALVLALMSKGAEINQAKIKEDKSQQVLNFIDLHIKEKHLLSIERIADHFNISRAYFNQYFRKATGSSYKKYIQQYALNIIAHQWMHRGKTLSELAFEYGYSDESHLSNAFKAHFGQSPTAFKKSNLA